MRIEEIKKKDIVYKVKENETLLDIAKKFNTTVDSLKLENNISEVEFGDVIIILEKNLAVHVVKPAETLLDIAKKYHTTTKHIIELNNLASANIFIGQKLVI